MRVLPPELEDWMGDYVRDQLRVAGVDVQVGNKEPDDLGRQLPLTRPMIVIRDDSGPRTDWTTFSRSIGVTVLAGTKRNDKPANDLARLVASIVFDTDLPLVPGSPIVSVVLGGCNGPYAVTEQLDIARRYLTAQYVVSGSW